MACQGCINRQRMFVRVLCKSNPDSKLCKKAQERLERMEGKK
jgi:hypothetical protein